VKRGQVVEVALGRILATPGALEALAESGQTAREFLERHARGDWGNVAPEDRLLNEQALRTGARLFSSYKTRQGVTIWVISEAANRHGQRAATTLLLPEEY
jgi:hypothetical protein